MQCQNSPGSFSAAPKWIISTQNTNTALVIAGRLQFIFLWNTIQESTRKVKGWYFFFSSYLPVCEQRIKLCFDVLSSVWQHFQSLFALLIHWFFSSLDKAMNDFYSLCCIRYVNAKKGIQLILPPNQSSGRKYDNILVAY